VRWRPFYLDPTLPREGVDKMALYNRKFGEQRMAQMIPHMQKVGLADGITFDYGGKVAATTDAHRLIELSWSKGGASLQDKVVEELFKDYFERQGNLGSADVLAAAGARAGLGTEEEVRAFLSSRELTEEVERDVVAFARRYRINGVPFTVMDGRYGVSGAQDAEAFLEVFEELAATAAAPPQ
jgi:predicted DsbA family dithiol-disulfide isomerase